MYNYYGRQNLNNDTTMTASNTVQTSVISSSALNITVSELKEQLGLYGDTSEDSYLESLIFSAEEIASNYIGTPISAIEVTDYFQAFAKRLEFSSKFITSTSNSDVRVRYYDNSRVLQTYANSNYFIDTTGEYPSIVKISTSDFPLISQDHKYPIQISYTAGITASEERPFIKQAILMLAMELYTCRFSSEVQMYKPNLNAMGILNNLKRIII